MEEKERKYWILGLRVFFDFSATIAIPAVIFVFVGRWIDITYNKTPLFTILAFFFAFGVSAKIIVKKAKAYGEEYMNIEEKNNKKSYNDTTYGK